MTLTHSRIPTDPHHHELKQNILHIVPVTVSHLFATRPLYNSEEIGVFPLFRPPMWLM